jgi:hypothetical protein
MNTRKSVLKNRMVVLRTTGKIFSDFEEGAISSIKEEGLCSCTVALLPG